ncbi:hypothetical protein [Zooshikella harenae]|uniref:Peptidase S54 rhomboid domain-containing protein n=1 Tax=Zooshikella harenae TaxID=2827238 RepID=A0ABS5ZCQ2_9GAMM|nr:hypothetical protein [Zooshikella harenae]MBU2711745.1 hypothetical protein [Zooshikella harenae]
MNPRLKAWVLAIALFSIFVLLLAFDAELKDNLNVSFDMQVDHIGHALGAVGAIIYCRVRPRTLTKVNL